MDRQVGGDVLDLVVLDRAWRVGQRRLQGLQDSGGVDVLERGLGVVGQLGGGAVVQPAALVAGGDPAVLDPPPSSWSISTQRMCSRWW
jgi:hypothetical protein